MVNEINGHDDDDYREPVTIYDQVIDALEDFHAEFVAQGNEPDHDILKLLALAREEACIFARLFNAALGFQLEIAEIVQDHPMEEFEDGEGETRQ